MEKPYATALLICHPIFVILLTIEITYGYFVKKQMHKVMTGFPVLVRLTKLIIRIVLGLAVDCAFLIILVGPLQLQKLRLPLVVWTIVL